MTPLDYRKSPGQVVTIETEDIRDLVEPSRSRIGCAVYAVCPKCKTLYLNVSMPYLYCPHRTKTGKLTRVKCEAVFAPVRKL